MDEVLLTLATVISRRSGQVLLADDHALTHSLFGFMENWRRGGQTPFPSRIFSIARRQAGRATDGEREGKRGKHNVGQDKGRASEHAALDPSKVLAQRCEAAFCSRLRGRVSKLQKGVHATWVLASLQCTVSGEFRAVLTRGNFEQTIQFFARYGAMKCRAFGFGIGKDVVVGDVRCCGGTRSLLSAEEASSSDRARICPRARARGVKQCCRKGKGYRMMGILFCVILVWKVAVVRPRPPRFQVAHGLRPPRARAVTLQPQIKFISLCS